jgi:hypothetical protein
MSSQRRARDDDKRLGRFYFPLPAAPAPRNPVVAAMAHRASSQGAGRHLRTRGAERRAQRVALLKAARQIEEP